jgi:hypothetical protein
MKKLLLFLLAHISWDCPLFAQCEPSTFVFNLTPGITKSGAFFSMEAGIWPIEGRLGAMAGPLMYNEKHHTAKGIEKLTEIDLIGRAIYKLTPTGSDYPQLVTVFGTVRGMVGISYRAYISIGETQLVGIEPMYINRLGVGVTLLFTARL